MLLDSYKEIIHSKMGEKRYTHSVNVCNEAIRLAKLYGADAEKAAIAGILHDVAKEMPKEAQLQIIKNGGIMLDTVERASPKLWHAVAGSAYIKHELTIQDTDIINAVRYHTTGRANMTLLEQIIFVADFTSCERNYTGVEIMREKADRSLTEAMLYGVAFSIADLAARNLMIHPNAVNLYNEIILKKEVY